MASFRQGCVLALSLTLWAAAAQAAEQSPGLYDRPVLVVDAGMHTARHWRAATDRDGNWAATTAGDKTVRVWSVADGALARTIRLPAGPGYVGEALAVAISPDGSLIAAGGWTGANGQERNIYLLDRASGSVVKRIDGLPNVMFHLTFSRDGSRLAATLFFGGIRLYDRDQGWNEVARDGDYSDQSCWAAFAPDGQLATTAFDGKVRLYAADLKGTVHPTVTMSSPGGKHPFGVAFSPPDGSRLVVGYDDSAAVTLLDGHTLAELPGPDVEGIAGGNLMVVAWSRDGRTLFAAGKYRPTDSYPAVVAWSDVGAGERRILSAARNTIMSLVPLLDGDLLVATADPWLGRLRPDGTGAWANRPPQVNFGLQFDKLKVSNDGTRIGFGYALLGKQPATFELTTRALKLDPPSDADLTLPRQDGLPIKDWRETVHPMVSGRPLALDRYEMSRSLGIDPAGGRFVLGTEWSLRAFDASGKPLWTRPAPGVVWEVNITGDGRLVVAAYHDGTIRWHRMTDGVELLAFMPLADRTNWIAWTPEGFYAATPGAHGILRWHVNRGWDAPADSIPIGDIPGSYRPAILPLVLHELETPRALGLAMLAEHNKEVAIRTHSQLPPGVQLHLLTIGISAYNEDYAKNLRLHYADRDARDLASAIITTQEGLYSKVTAQALLDKDANRGGILRGLQTLRTAMERKGGDDLAVVHFSGHGAVVDGRLYLLPQETDARDAIGIKNTALSIDDLRAELLELAKRGRVLVLLDACHSGATTMDGTPLVMDSTALRTGLAAANVTVLTSSRGNQKSREDAEWGHGAFTKTLLDALNDPTADTNRTGLINATGLANYIAGHVASLTHGKQTPDMEIRFGSTVFAVGM